MKRLRWAILALGLSGTIAALAVARPGRAGGVADSPEARLRARIADLHVEVAVLDMECAAIRENLLQSLKNAERYELGDRAAFLSAIKRDLNFVNQENEIAAVRRRIEARRTPGVKEGADLPKRGEKASDVQDSQVEAEFSSRLRSARDEADRMKAEFQKKVRALHQKRRELDDAEAEYRATK